MVGPNQRIMIPGYFVFFEFVGFKRFDISYSFTLIYTIFYHLFDDTLERYPRFDLERDFLHVILVKET